MADVSRLKALYLSGKSAQDKLVKDYKANSIRMPAVVSRRIFLEIGAYEKNLAEARRVLVEAGETGLGFPLAWMAVIAVAAAGAYAAYMGFGAYEKKLEDDNKKRLFTQKNVDKYGPGVAIDINQSLNNEQPFFGYTVKPAATGFGLGAIVALAAVIWFMFKEK